ncbi:hypothetical protein [Streptomyces sp. NPDC001927]
MPSDRFTRSVGIRLAVLARSHLQAKDLDQSLAVGSRALTALRTVSSTRAHGYLLDYTASLEPWRKNHHVSEFIHQTRTELATTPQE